MPRVLAHHDFIDTPWKNGRGVTTEIFRMDAKGQMVFRISSAVVTESGDFSDFTGYDRSLVNIGAGDMYLTHGVASSDGPGDVLAPMAVTHFDGGVKTYCRVSEGTRDLNIFCAKNQYFASTIVRKLIAPEFFPVPVLSNTLIFVVEGSLVVQNSERLQFFVQQGDALLEESKESRLQDRWMLASASNQTCVLVTIVFRATDP